MIEPILVTLGVAALGATGIRLMRGQDSLHEKVDHNTERLANIEGRLSNGIQAELRRLGEVDSDMRELKHDFKDLADKVEDHMDHEEQRVVDIYRKLVEGGGR